MDLPASHDTVEFRDAWESWIAYRKLRKLPKYKTQRVLINLLLYPVPVALEAIEHSLNNEYAGLFPSKFGRENVERHERLGKRIQRSGRLSAPAGKYSDLDTQGIIPFAGAPAANGCGET